MKKVRIITDSAADFISAKQDNLTVLPMKISFGGDDYLDGITIDHHTFYEKLIESDALPTTSLISPIMFEEEFEKAAEAGEQTVVITISSKLSGTHRCAVMAAEQFPEDVFVIDSLSATIGEQILVKYALELADKGLEAKKIAEELEIIKNKIQVFGLLDTLEYLKKGGRISKTVAFVGGALNIKPIVTVKNGEVVMAGKAKGYRNGSKFLIQSVEKAGGVDFSKPFYLGYTGLTDEKLGSFIEDSQALWQDYNGALPSRTIGATVGTHIGPNAVAIAFVEKD